VVVTLLVVGVVSLSALIVRSSFRVDALQASLTTLQADHEDLAIDVVTLSAPSRIAAWARDRGMVRADEVHVLRVRADGTDG
jgi:hypothetical protein